jgi:hypothetical protein
MCIRFYTAGVNVPRWRGVGGGETLHSCANLHVKHHHAVANQQSAIPTYLINTTITVYLLSSWLKKK